MRRIDKLYDWLAQGPAPDCDQVLTAALEFAEPPYFERITQCLLQRNGPAAWGGLIQYFPHLPRDTQRQVTANKELLCGGIVEALKTASASGRQNALQVLEAHPSVSLAYLLPDALQNRSTQVRDAAARILRGVAELFLALPRPVQNTADEPQANPEPDKPTAYEAERRQMVRAAREALRTFSRYPRVDVLEVCLWFAEDLEDELWVMLENPRSRCGQVVQEHLPIWDRPYLAGFLLLALARAEWRYPAQQVLRSWQTLSQVAALLQAAQLLEEAEIRAGLAAIKPPAWFAGLGMYLEKLPAALRRHAPQWVCCLGFSKEQKIRYLSEWAKAPDLELRRAATAALATLGVAQAGVSTAEP